MTRPMVCQVCTLGLTKQTVKDIFVSWLHPLGTDADHTPVPVPMPEAIDTIRCDFCGNADAVIVFLTKSDTGFGAEGRRTRIVGHQTHHTGRHGTRIRDLNTRELTRGAFGATERDAPLNARVSSNDLWGACVLCEPLVDAKDLWGLVSRVWDCAPELADVPRRKLAEQRAQLSAQIQITLDLIGRKITVAEALERLT